MAIADRLVGGAFVGVWAAMVATVTFPLVLPLLPDWCGLSAAGKFWEMRARLEILSATD
jgi:hypothetical protein